MPYDDPDPTDPMTLHGVVLDADEPPPLGAVREMAECFVDEYARLGFDRGRILRIFTNPGYAGPYMAYEMLGENEVFELVNNVLARWGPMKKPEPLFQRNAQGAIGLSVIE
ncbi:MAG: hypothetical protein AAB363_11780 [Planctomycetota bacterium]